MDAIIDFIVGLDVTRLTIMGYPMTTEVFLVSTLATVALAVLTMAAYAHMVDFSGAKTPRSEAIPGMSSEVVSLRVYPIKSCRGIELPEAKLKRTGLDLDRNWMFVDAADKKFLTIRSDSSMTLIDTGLSTDGVSTQYSNLHISLHGTDAYVKIPCYPTEAWLTENTTRTEVEIWGEKTDAWAYSDAINSIFSKYFQKPVILVYKGPSPRFAGGNADAALYGKSVPHHFADLMSYQIASEASLEDLNEKLRAKGSAELTIERFRPNIIIKGAKAWEEDSWKRIRINTTEPAREMLWRVEMDVLARCARCQVPNVDPDTAEKDKHEPWDTLMSFRRVDEGGPAKYKPCFGMLCIPTKTEGVVKVGSTLDVLETTDKHLYNKAKFGEL